MVLAELVEEIDEPPQPVQGVTEIPIEEGKVMNPTGDSRIELVVTVRVRQTEVKVRDMKQHVK